MNIRTKKKNADGIVRLETSGGVKEILFRGDFLNPKSASVALCFRGQASSGIVELSADEAQRIAKEIIKRVDLVQSSKVIEFDKA